MKRNFDINPRLTPTEQAEIRKHSAEFSEMVMNVYRKQPRTIHKNLAPGANRAERRALACEIRHGRYK